MHNLSSSSTSSAAGGSPCFSEKIVPVFRVGVMRVDDGGGRERTKGGFPMSRDGINSELIEQSGVKHFCQVSGVAGCNVAP